MPTINKTLGNVKAMKRKVDTLNIEVNVGDYWTTIRELKALSKGTPNARIIELLSTDLQRFEKTHDKALMPKMSSKLTTIIDWLGSLEAAKV